MPGDSLQRLQAWYHDHCDGTWEHEYEVRIDTLDNPGWSLVVDLLGTALAARSFSRVEDLGSEDEWISCEVVAAQFKGHGGPRMLGRILDVFLDWATAYEKGPA